ncbi:MAG: ZPR1 zinc finger domain-containing protein [Thermoprotei archaeon]
MEKVLDYDMKCPVCGREFKVSEYLYEAPYVGKIVISSGVCPRCGYKWSDVRLAESKGPRRIVYEVERPEDLNALVVRASTAKVIIPEIGAELVPGYAAQGYITTVEGLVMDFYEKTKFLCESGEVPREECEEKLKAFEDALNAKFKYTIIIEDPMGVSTVVSSKAREEKLEEKEETD